jgi:glucosamine--fructose-6-phosphate aminotransferase (isomerizing)
MLKMKEMSLSYSEAYHPLEFRHGPKSVVNTESLVVGLLTDEARAQETAVLSDMKELGARTLAVAEGGGPKELGGADYAVDLASDLSMADRLVLYLPVCTSWPTIAPWPTGRIRTGPATSRRW